MRFFWIFYFCSTLLFAQQSQWRSITTADGLSHGTVFDLLQDQEGYVWMATKAGLNRYDGDNFKVFTTHTTPSYAITSNQTTALYEDHHHRLWIGTESGELNLFDLQTQRFYHCFLTNKKNILPAVRQHIYCISEDSRGDLWVGTLTGEIYKVSLPNDLKKGGFPDKEDFSDCVEVAFLNTNLASTMRVNFIKLLKNKQLVVGTQAGFGRIDYINHQYIPIKIEPIGTGRFLNIYEAPDGRFILTQPTQVLAYKGNKITVLYSKSNLNNLPSQIRIDDLGNVFILENRKLFKAHYTQLTPDITTMPPIYQSDNFTLFSGLKSDCNGSAWINTGGYGLLKETRGPQQFKHYFKGRSIWVGFQDTYNRWVINNFKAFYLATSTDAQNLPPAPTYIDTHAMIEDGKGGYWQLQNDASNFSKMFLKRLQKDLRVVEEYPLEGQGVGENLGRLYKDKQGNLLITGLGSSIIKFDTLQKRVGYYSYEKIVPANVKVYSAYCDGQGTWWLGTQNGLLQAVSHFKGGYQFRLLKHHSKYTTTLSENQVSMMVDDPYKPATYLWVGTLGGGLNRMNKTNGTFEHFTVNDGLPDDYIVGILADDNKNLWLSTYHGLVQFNPRTFVSAIFTSKDGLQADEFAVASCFKTNRGELAFGGVNGLTVFSPAALQRTKASQLPKINQLKINNQEVMPGDETEILAQSIEQTSSIQLAHDQNQVTLSFSLIDLENAPKNRFRYQLLGIDKKRIEAGTTHSVTYSQLPSGSYTFQLTGSADGSQWSAPVEFKITVNPPLYRTWWAYLCYLSLVSLIVYRLYLAQLNRVRLQEQLLYKNKEAERLGELDAIKTNFFANISHEFRTPLTLILGPMEQIIQEYEADVRFPVIQRNASRLLTLINQLLDISKLEAGQMAPEITSTELVRYFRT
ncbi:MAG TPA: hypothetical protein DCR35_17415, partial [Runella sp.]|nr:hypothetical protein [Runella sp.]